MRVLLVEDEASVVTGVRRALEAEGYDVAEGLDLGDDDYITKPFSTVELLARVRGPGGAAGLEVGDLRLDPRARRCWRGDAEIELTGRETSLLAVLFRNAAPSLDQGPPRR